MDLKETIKIIDFEKNASKEEELEECTVFFRDLYGVNLKKNDGTYKSLLDIFEEASKNHNK